MSTLTSMSRVTVARIGFVLIFIVLALISWFMVLAPRAEQATSLTTQAEDTDLRNLALMKQLRQTKDELQDAPAVAQRAQELLAQMPQTADLPAVLDQITAAAVEAGIDPNEVSTISTGIPTPVTETGLPADVQLAQMSVSLTATGSRQQVYDFLDNLQSLDRSLLVNSTQVSQPTDLEAQTNVTLQVVGTMFVLQSALPDLVAQVDTLLADEVLVSIAD